MKKCVIGKLISGYLYIRLFLSHTDRDSEREIEKNILEEITKLVNGKGQNLATQSIFSFLISFSLLNGVCFYFSF